MELSQQNKKELLKVKNRITPILVGYVRKDYVCEVDRKGNHLYYNEPKEISYIPSLNIKDYCIKHKNIAKAIAHHKLMQRKKIAQVIYQSFAFIGLCKKSEKPVVSIVGFKKCSI